jgi:putative transcriptional regulator
MSSDDPTPKRKPRRKAAKPIMEIETRRALADLPSEHSAADDEAAEGFLTGKLLIAMPGLTGSAFSQSVIYVCAHTTEGALGIIVNRPLESPSFDDLLRQLDIAPVPPARRIRLCQGGPVDNARGFVLHTADWTGDGSLLVEQGLALTASLDILKAIANGGGPRECLLALGYAGWGPGQLDREFQDNAWLSLPVNETLVFDAEHETKWRRALATLHIDPLLLSGIAGHS